MTGETLRKTQGAVFLDRDGVLNDAIPGGHVLTRQAWRWLPRARDALAFLAKKSGRRIVIATNQSPIGRGWVPRERVDALHAWMVGEIEEAGGRVDGVYVCPHAPEEGCTCRKPAPGLFLHAARDLGVDLSASAVVGDAVEDIQAAWAAGVRECYRVCCGLPFEDPPLEADKYTIVGTLSEAALAIVGRERHDR